MERTILSAAQRSAMEFLRTHLPQSDLDCYGDALFLRFADHALALREGAPWCAALDEEIFLHYAEASTHPALPGTHSLFTREPASGQGVACPRSQS